MYSLRVILALALVLSMAACSSKPKRTKAKSGTSNSGPTGTNPSTRPGTPGGSGAAQVFVTALGRIAAADATRTGVRFSDHTALRELGGQWQALVGYGAADAVLAEAEAAGTRPAQALYAVSAGTGATLTVLAGGQDPAAVKTALTAKGWTVDGDRLVAPAKAAGATARTAGAYPMVRAIGADVLIAKDAASLGTVSPATSLAADPLLRPLADCLGGVVAARYAVTPVDTIAAGVLRPASDGKIHAVVCSANTSPAAAEGSALRQRTQYENFRSPIAGATPAAALFDDVTVTVIGSVVRVEAVVAAPGTVLDAFARQDLPGLKFR